MFCSYATDMYPNITVSLRYVPTMPLVTPSLSPDVAPRNPHPTIPADSLQCDSDAIPISSSIGMISCNSQLLSLD